MTSVHLASSLVAGKVSRIGSHGVEEGRNVSHEGPRCASIAPTGIARAPDLSSFRGLGLRQCGLMTRRSHGQFALRVQAAVGVKERVLERNDKEKGSVVVIDNYDSFTYNLCQYLGDLGCKIEVYRNDEITVEEIRKKKPRGILISPGPGTPQDSGISLEIVRKLGPTIPLFGVCMGLQCMGEAFGGKIVRAPNGVMHGKTSPVFYDEGGEPGVLDGLPRCLLLLCVLFYASLSLKGFTFCERIRDHAPPFYLRVLSLRAAITA
ncbi:anthranilate synthase beta subunit 1, chloroplastic isoform X2 [Physcomitrium patens]|uniref:anthranilate synthase beta subunit 1, chloroplastic isoform X2 n=1 Tax=Physcomitrium patens TaxID=3218 RepID=UPI003CCD29BA